MIGTKLSHYEITSHLGTGGMGEVYQATDSKLGRNVAIKLLPEAVARDGERVARFEREARLLASLNHPNIAAIYGVEEFGGRKFLIMELAPGETLAKKIERGAIPVDETLRIARQITEALEVAHEKGVVHRDLKPANIKVAADGKVKVLDFGLATVHQTEGMGLSAAPTKLTQSAVVIGTMAYMSPEQAKGKEVDRTTDIWAFGCVLYEMLTGRAVFEGETAGELLEGVFKTEPDWNRLPRNTPSMIRKLLRRCLHKEKKLRLHDMADARLEIDEASTESAETFASLETTAPEQLNSNINPKRRALFAVGGAVGGALIAGLALWSFTSGAPPRVTRTMITSSLANALSIDGSDRDLVITPDGMRILYSGNNQTQIFVRSLDQLEATALVTTPSAVHGIFASPNGEWIGFVEGTNTLKKVASTGGPPITLMTMDGNSLGSAWARDDSIIFATSNPTTGLQRVPANGGVAETLTLPNRDRGEADHVWPEILPKGSGVLFTITPVSGGVENAQIAVLDLAKRTWKTLVQGGHHAHYVAGGYLVYAAGTALRAVAFDLDALEVRGTSVLVVPRLVTTDLGAADFSVATNGTLVYVDAPVNPTGRRLVWVDRKGQETPLAAPPRAYQYPRLTPDGTGITLTIGGQSGLWVWDLQNSTLRRPSGSGSNPVWTPDGKRIVLGEEQGGGGLVVRAADGTGNPERLTEGPNIQVATSITPDGGAVIFHEITPTRGRDLRLVKLAQRRSPEHSTALLDTVFDERNGMVSPDGHWLAYESDGSGQFEIYVRPFPNVNDGQWQVSTNGGRQPLWATSNHELFYVALDGVLSVVPVEPRGSIWAARTPQPMFDRRYYSGGGVPRQYDVSRDGQRFVMLKQGAGDTVASPPQIVVVQNWFEELKKQVHVP
jgi:eukaryotic-like serine/threonine-protein kinase